MRHSIAPAARVGVAGAPDHGALPADLTGGMTCSRQTRRPKRSREEAAGAGVWRRRWGRRIASRRITCRGRSRGMRQEEQDEGLTTPLRNKPS
eukprot:204937-Hanusia_phi.AAC.1